MKSPLLLLSTLLLSVWFCISSTAANAQRKIEDKGQLVPSSIRLRAQQGDPRAEYLVGRSYMTGASPNYGEAAKWFRQSAAQGSADAEFSLGYLYEHGDGVPRDYQQALFYYSAAAKQGHLTAENNLASMYENGRGAKKNIKEAERWYRAAAEDSEVVAQGNLASLYFRAHNYSEAVIWFRAAAQQGDAAAQENLAWMYYTGTGITLDFGEAAKWVRLAAAQGHARAELDLGYLYEQGKGVPLDYSNAYVWYTAAAIGGEKRAAKRIKSVERVMTPDQINKARAAAEQLSKSLPRVNDVTSSNSIVNSFTDPQ